MIAQHARVAFEAHAARVFGVEATHDHAAPRTDFLIHRPRQSFVLVHHNFTYPNLILNVALQGMPKL
jgi:hypothetical protein